MVEEILRYHYVSIDNFNYFVQKMCYLLNKSLIIILIKKNDYSYGLL